MNYKLLATVVCGVSLLCGQTRLDLANQTQNDNFTGASSTRPATAGTVLPTTCATGQMFLLLGSGAPQLEVCNANAWTATGSGSSALTVELGGSGTVSGNTLNLLAGTGIVMAATASGTQVNLQAGIDTGMVQTQTGAQSGAAMLCASQSGSATAYTCSLNPQAQGYTQGMVLHWIPDVSGSGNGPVTLNVDTLGAVNLKRADGSTDPVAGDIVAGQLYPVWYDGAEFRLASAVSSGCNWQQGGYAWPFGVPGTPAPAGNPGSLTLHASQFELGCSMTLNKVSYNVANASACASTPCNLVFGLYDSSLNLVSVSQVTQVAANGAATATWSAPQRLNAGTTYYLAYMSDSSAMTLYSLGSSDFGALMNQTAARSGTAAALGTGTGSSIALPAALGGISSQVNNLGVPPEVLFQ